MSIEQQNTRIAEAPAKGWIIWVSEDAFALVEELVRTAAEDPEETLERRKLAEDFLEGIY